MHKLNVTHELSEVGGNDTPRWRRTKRRHRSRFTDTLSFFFRIKQYHVSIQQLRDSHVKMRRERRELLTSLDVAHREVYKTEDLSLRMNREYSRAKGLRENRIRVQKELDEATGELSECRDQEATVMHEQIEEPVRRFSWSAHACVKTIRLFYCFRACVFAVFVMFC